MGITESILANRKERANAATTVDALDAALTNLVKTALTEGHTAAELAEIMGVSRARVYQIRDGRR